MKTIIKGGGLSVQRATHGASVWVSLHINDQQFGFTALDSEDIGKVGVVTIDPADDSWVFTSLYLKCPNLARRLRYQIDKAIEHLEK